jgi:hypothetical protein
MEESSTAVEQRFKILRGRINRQRNGQVPSDVVHRVVSWLAKLWVVVVRPSRVDELELAADLVSVEMAVRRPPIDPNEALWADAGFDGQPNRDPLLRPILHASKIEFDPPHDDALVLKCGADFKSKWATG